MNKKIVMTTICVLLVLVAVIIFSVFTKTKDKTIVGMTSAEKEIVNLKGKKLKEAYEVDDKHTKYEYIDDGTIIVTLPEVAETEQEANSKAQLTVELINTHLEKQAEEWNTSHNHKNDPYEITKKFSCNYSEENEKYYEYVGESTRNYINRKHMVGGGESTTKIIIRIFKKSYFDFEKLNIPNITSETVQELGNYLCFVNSPYKFGDSKFINSFVKEDNQKYIYTAYYINKGIYYSSPMVQRRTKYVYSY